MKSLKLIAFCVVTLLTLSLEAVVWNSPVTVDSVVGDNLETPDVAINDAGQIITIWNLEGSNNDLVSHATWGTQTWSTPFNLVNQDDSKWFPMVHIDSQGRGVVIIPDGSNPVYQATYDGTTWTAVSVITGAVFNEAVLSPSLSGNSTGKAVATWVDITSTSIQYATFTWPTFAAAITHGTTGDVEAPPRVSINDSEAGMLAWGPTGLASMMASPYVSATGAFTPDATLTVGAGQNEFPAVDINASGQAVATWYDFSSGDAIAAAIFNGTTWSSAVTVATPPSFEDRTLRVKMDNNGNALAIWQEGLGAGVPGTLYSAFYNAATGTWGSPVIVSNNVYSDSSFPSLTLGFDMQPSTGNAVVIFFGINSSIADGMFVLGSVFDAASQTWDTPQVLDQGLALSASDPLLVASAAVNNGGETVAVWSLIPVGSTFALNVNSAFTTIASPNALGLIAHARKNRFPTQTEYYNALTWNRAVTGTVTEYRLFRDGALIVVLPSGENSYNDRERPKNQRVTYTLVATNSGGQTTSASVTVN